MPTVTSFHLLRLAPLLLLLACARPPHHTASTPAANQYADATQRQIATAQDERNAAALLPFLTNANPEYRRTAALALASVQEKTASAFLVPLLRDGQPAVRRAAAYALGQTADSATVDSLRVRILLEKDGLTRRYVHEALGRCVTRRSLPELWRVEILTDTARAAALALGLERAAIRGLVSAESVRRTVQLLTAFPGLNDASRLAAATALARAPRSLDADVARLAGPTLLRLLAKDKYFAVRSAAATALGHAAAGTPGAVAALARIATHDADARVRVVALRALPFETASYAGSRAAVLAALSDARPGVALTAAEWLLAHAKGETGADLAARADKLAWRPRAVLLAAALKQASPGSRASLTQIIKTRYQAAVSPYEKGYLLQALAEGAPYGVVRAGRLSTVLDTLDEITPTFTAIETETFVVNQNPIVAGYGLASLLALRRRATIPKSLQSAFAADMRRALAGGDLNQLSIAADALADKKLYPTAQPDDLAALRAAQTKLQLPRDIEAWQEIQKALDRLEGRATPTAAPVGQAAQQPIDWAVVQGLPQNQLVRMHTTQGDITLALKVNEAPGASAAFATLVRQHFYDGLAFHRVIANFVAQGGDPRGDGAGSAPYTLRSEFGDLRYGTGSVGLASAGKDTESCQFFFTLAPTPHLDGRYPIFAEVTQGLDVLPKLEIGDKMLTVELVNVP